MILLFQIIAKLVELLKTKREMCYKDIGVSSTIQEKKVQWGSYHRQESGTGKLGRIKALLFWRFLVSQLCFSQCLLSFSFSLQDSFLPFSIKSILFVHFPFMNYQASLIITIINKVYNKLKCDRCYGKKNSQEKVKDQQQRQKAGGGLGYKIRAKIHQHRKNKQPN